MYFLDTVEKYSAGKQNMLDKSGSCAIVVLFVDELCFVANVGDSRAIMSCSGGKYTASLSNDHKPNDSSEHMRILQGGGKIYQT
jgi:serine/threonine protein phosphatase PrpC